MMTGFLFLFLSIRHENERIEVPFIAVQTRMLSLSQLDASRISCLINWLSFQGVTHSTSWVYWLSKRDACDIKSGFDSESVLLFFLSFILEWHQVWRTDDKNNQSHVTWTHWWSKEDVRSACYSRNKRTRRERELQTYSHALVFAEAVVVVSFCLISKYRARLKWFRAWKTRERKRGGRPNRGKLYYYGVETENDTGVVEKALRLERSHTRSQTEPFDSNRTE